MAIHTLETCDKFMSRGEIYVPLDIIGVMEAFSDFSSGQEYGLFLSSDLDLNNLTARVASECWELPSQEVTGASIKFIDYRSDTEVFNSVVHRHPHGCRHFSGVDNEYVNKDFDVSFLFLQGGELPSGIINIKIAPNTFIRVPACVSCDVPLTPELLLNAKMEAIDAGATKELFESKVQLSKYEPVTDYMDDLLDQKYGQHYSRARQFPPRSERLPRSKLIKRSRHASDIDVVNRPNINKQSRDIGASVPDWFMEDDDVLPDVFNDFWRNI